MAAEGEWIKVTIDGSEVQLRKGTNLIEAARIAGVEIPHYCYHQHLSVAGNCRMCQVEIEGSAKLSIACNTVASDGMVVHTHQTSEAVREAQRATLEFLLINHPLDCTVCDQAGHCKLQDYFYQYNAQASRFIGEKVHKVKALALGPEVMLDAERCILCTRCVRFCEEITKTSELAVFSRGDHSVIGIYPGHELQNPLSGTVVDLCPVGALTHRRWRFNTRIWYTNLSDSICPGCSTGCSAQVAVRDGEVVLVKARLNSLVNKEWLCDEGRYGFERFQPRKRLERAKCLDRASYQELDWQKVIERSAALKSATGDLGVFISPFLTLEELWLLGLFCEKVLGLPPGSAQLALQARSRMLSVTEQILISPDYAPNLRAGAVLGFFTETNFREEAERRYQALLDRVRKRELKRLLFVGDFALSAQDEDEELLQAIAEADFSLHLTPRDPEETSSQSTGHTGLGIPRLQSVCKLILPSRTVLEKTGVFVTAQGHLQRLQAVLQGVSGSRPEWHLLLELAKGLGEELIQPLPCDEQSLLQLISQRVPALQGLSWQRLGSEGLSLAEAAVERKESLRKSQTHYVEPEF